MNVETVEPFQGAAAADNPRARSGTMSVAEAIHELIVVPLGPVAGASSPHAIVPPIIDAMADDAQINASGLPFYANRNQAKANLLTLISNSLAALTALAIWATLQASPAWWAKVVVASAALLSAVLGFLPGIYHWNENAATARRLASRYGRLYGDILKLKGNILDGTTGASDEKIEELRTTLEVLKEQRQEINAEWKRPKPSS